MTDDNTTMSEREFRHQATLVLMGLCAGMSEETVEEIGKGIKGGKFYIEAAVWLSNELNKRIETDFQPRENS